LVYGRHDRVQEARVLAAAVDGTDGLVDVDGVAAGQLADLGDAGALQVAGYGLPDIHEGGQL